MPKIYEYLGIIFLFYADDHLPIHVHAKYQDFENKFEFFFENGILIATKIKKVKGKKSLPENKLKDAEKFIFRYNQGIAKKWNEFFVDRKSVV